jgi:hypothetical protein
MPNYGYHLARAQGGATRRAYQILLPRIAARPVEPAGELPFEMYAYSGESALPEQVASIRSLLRHAGRPTKFTMVSDGTHSQSSLELLRRIDPCVTISEAADWIPHDVPPEVRRYLSEHPTGKQLALIMSLPVNGPAFYVDSDVLFFSGASALRAFSAAQSAPALYQPDCQFSGDERLLRAPAEREQPANTGVLFLFQKLDWSLCIQRFLELDGPPTFFTNQTMTHLTMHANGAQPLDGQKYVLQLDDQFALTDRYAGPELVLRHYVNPVRHKFWGSVTR